MRVRVAVKAMACVVVASACGTDQPDGRGSMVPDPGDSLALERRLGGDDVFGAPVSIEVAGDVILVTDLLAQPFRVATLDRRTGAVKSWFGRVGEGPGELLAPMLTSSVADAGSVAYTIWDQARNLAEVGRYDPARDSVISRRSVRVGDTGRQLTGVVIHEGGVWATTVVGIPTLIRLDSTGAERRRFESEVAFATDAPGPGMPLNRTHFALDSAEGRAVLAFHYTPRIDVVDLASGEVQVARFRWHPGTVPDDVEPWSRPGYSDVVVTPRFLYALYRAAGERIATTVHRYRWDDASVTALSLGAPVSAIAVLPGDSLIYGTITEPIPGVGEWVVR